MLKKYIEKNADQGDSDRGEDAFLSSAVIDCTSDEQEDNDDIPSARNTEMLNQCQTPKIFFLNLLITKCFLELVYQKILAGTTDGIL